MAVPAEVLELVNRARVALGRECLSTLPKGHVQRSDCCALSRALDARVETGAVCFEAPRSAALVARAWNAPCRPTPGAAAGGPGYRVRMPDSLLRFCRDFDYGLYPELVAEEAGAATA